jgi:hypothetical protein
MKLGFKSESALLYFRTFGVRSFVAQGAITSRGHSPQVPARQSESPGSNKGERPACDSASSYWSKLMSLPLSGPQFPIENDKA